jgi:cation diffusion facilitator CzcD-associated flavoprotein CzcO
MKLYDAIIIGAGPAGLMATRELENNHINYLILEAKGKVGYPL